MTDDRYIASIDQGTTGTRFVVLNKEGAEVTSAYEEHKQICPKPGWVEHDPMEIWEKTKRVIKRAIEKKNLDPKKIDAIGVANQRETTLIWDFRTGMPLCNAIVWQCTRTRDICQKLIDRELGGMIKDRTGLLINTYFSGPKIKWILDNIPKAKEKVQRGEAIFGNIDTWIIWKLTGGTRGGTHVTDYTNASRTMLMNLKTLDWDDEILEELNIPQEMMPSIRPSSDRSIYGYTKREGPLGAKIPICGDLGDQQAALFGQACYHAGEAKNTYGTGNFMLVNTGSKPFSSKSGLLTTVAYGLEEGKVTYALEGAIAITGAAIQWLRDNLGLIKNASDTEKIAASAPYSGGIYFVPAFSGLFSPYWDMDARGTIVGITRFVRKEHLVRATLESICYRTKDVADAMIVDSGIRLTSLKVDGGASKNNFLMQLQADILGIPCIRPSFEETTALGSAYCAGLATGFWENLKDLRDICKTYRKFEPIWSEAKREKEYAGWNKAVECSRRWGKRSYI